MTTTISGTDGVDLIKDGTIVVADLKAGQTVGVQKMQLLTAQATTSGVLVDFTIPAWAKKITVMLNGVSGSGTSNFLVQLNGETTGYQAGVSQSGTTVQSVSGFILTQVVAAASFLSGVLTLAQVSSLVWAGAGTFNHSSANFGAVVGGSKTLSDVPTTLRLTTVNGTDTFDAGSVNVLVEGYE